LVFVNTKFAAANPVDDRGKLLHIIPHSLDCARAKDDHWIMPLNIVEDLLQEYGRSIHVGRCTGCKGRVAKCLQGISTTTHEFLTGSVTFDMLDMEEGHSLGDIIYWIGGAEAIAKLENQTGYSIFKNFVSPEQDPSGPNSNKFLGVDLKEIELSPERMEIFQNALGNSLESNVLVIGASILTTTGS